jgi:protein subunit release factor A
LVGRKRDFGRNKISFKKQWDLKGARERLEKIKNPDLRNQAQDEIRKIDDKYEKGQRNIFNTLTNVLDTQGDVVKAKKLLDDIKKPDLRQQAEAQIKEVEEKIKLEKLKEPDFQKKPDSIPTENPKADPEQNKKP